MHVSQVQAEDNNWMCQSATPKLPYLVQEDLRKNLGKTVHMKS
jgi:hypothetical protein